MLTILVIAILSFVLGAGCMYLIKRQPKPPGSDGWITVTLNSFPMGYDLDALTADGRCNTEARER